MNTIAQELAAFGYENNSAVRLAQELGESSTGKLKNLFTNMWDDTTVMSVNDRVNSMLIRYAFVDAVQQGLDHLTDEVIQNARERANGLATSLGTFNIREEELEQEEGEQGSESVRKGGKRTRNPELFPRIKSMVAQSPDATRDEIVARALKELDTNEGTATMYFYKARKELGLKNNGKRGRRPKTEIE